MVDDTYKEVYMGSIGNTQKEEPKAPITFNQISAGKYESSDGKYVITHVTGYKNVNVGNYSQKRKRDEWQVREKATFRPYSFKSLKLAQEFVRTGVHKVY